MSEDNKIPWSNDEQENPDNSNEITEGDLEQVNGGITPIPIPGEGTFKFRGDLTQVKLSPSLNNVMKDKGQLGPN